MSNIGGSLEPKLAEKVFFTCQNVRKNQPGRKASAKHTKEVKMFTLDVDVTVIVFDPFDFTWPLPL